MQWVVIALWLIYATLSLLSPNATGNHYHLASWQTFGLHLAIVLPVLVVWLVALRGALAFKHYAGIITGGVEARSMNLIAMGLLWLVAYLISLSLLGNILPYFAHSPAITWLVSLRNQVPPLINLIAFGLLYLGSHRLQRVVTFTTWTRGSSWLMVAFLIFASLFALEFATTDVPNNLNGIPIYTMSRPVLLVTMILPYMLAWFMGLLAAFNILKYARQVKGLLYRQALRGVARGIVAIVGCIAIFEVLIVAVRFLAGLSLGSLLLVMYALLLLGGLGFWWVQTGAQQLGKLEVTE